MKQVCLIGYKILIDQVICLSNCKKYYTISEHVQKTVMSTVTQSIQQFPRLLGNIIIIIIR